MILKLKADSFTKCKDCHVSNRFIKERNGKIEKDQKYQWNKSTKEKKETLKNRFTNNLKSKRKFIVSGKPRSTNIYTFWKKTAWCVLAKT